MWPKRRNVPAQEHESCARRYAELLERIEALELTAVERHMQVMEIAEKVSERLTERVRKRTPKVDQGDDIDRIIRLRRGGFDGVHEGGTG